MEIRYVNHLGAEINLSTAPYLALGGDLLNYDWTLNTVARADGRGGRVASFSREVSIKQLPVQIWAHTASEYYAAVDALHDAFETDIDALEPGTLYVGDSYVSAYATASTKEEWDDGVDFMLNTITLAIESVRWNSDTDFEFPVYTNTGATGFRYPGKYPAKYCSSGGVQTIINTHFSPTPAVITFYGPANEPTIRCGDNIYTVYTEIYENERLVIDQLNMSVYRVTSTGEIENEFANRSKDPSVFGLFPTGEMQVYYNGAFGFEITLVAQRSEPKWA